MKSLKYLICLMIIVTLAMPMVSAYDWDNTLSYESKDGIDNKVVYFENAFGLPLIGETLAKAELMTPMHNYVGTGMQRVMIYDIENYGNVYNDWLREIEIVDMKTGKTINQDFELEYAIYETKRVPEFGEVYSGIDSNGSKIYKTQVVGFHDEEVIKEWKRLTNEDFPQGKLTIALVTYVKPGDYKDGIFTMFGGKVKRHAVWSSDLDVDLISYYTLDDTGNDSVSGSYNISWSANPTYRTGKINNATYSDGTYFGNTIINLSNTAPMSISLWFNWSDQTDSGLLGTRNLAGTRGFYMKLEDNNGKIELTVFNLSGSPIDDIAWTEATTINDSQWHHVALLFDGYDGWELYLDGTNMTLSTSNSEVYGGSNLTFFKVGEYSGIVMTGMLDEIAIWNRTITASEITSLYNSGSGIVYGEYIELNSPADSYSSSNKSVIFNCSFSDSTGPTALYLYIDSSLNHTIVNTTAFQNLSLEVSRNLSYGEHTWYCNATNSTQGFMSATRTLNITRFTENSQTYNATTYEMVGESFKINLTSITDAPDYAYLNYNGTDYAATITNTTDTEYIISKSFSSIPLHTGIGVENRSFYYKVEVDGTNQSSTSYNQTVYATNFTLCNTTRNVTYINFTFADDDTESVINGTIATSTWTYYIGSSASTKTYRYISPTEENISYGFCLVPTDRTLYMDYELQYSLTGYPQRRHSDSSAILTNGTTNKVLYLLSSADGQYSTYRVENSAGSSIDGVAVVVEKQFGGVWTTVEQGTTDDAGAVTFWLNPDYDHQFTLTKTGYTSVTKTIRPSQSSYTITMGGGDSTNATQSFALQGIKWIITPASGVLTPSTTYTFGFNVTKVNESNLVDCRMRLIDDDGTILSTTTGCTSTGGYISTNYVTPADGRMYGEYSLDVGDGYVIIDSDAMWRFMTVNASQGTIWQTLNNLKDLNEFGSDDNRREFSRIIIFYLILTIVMGTITKSTGWDFATMGGGIYFLCGIVWIASFAGVLTLTNVTGIGRFPFIDKYFVAAILTFLTIVYVINMWRKS